GRSLLPPTHPLDPDRLRGPLPSREVERLEPQFVEDGDVSGRRAHDADYWQTRHRASRGQPAAGRAASAPDPGQPLRDLRRLSELKQPTNFLAEVRANRDEPRQDRDEWWVAGRAAS